MVVRYVRDLSGEESVRLAEFCDQPRAGWCPYHLPVFARVVDDVFGYENLSLVAVGDNGGIVGYVPQWRVGRALVSVPWRDKGGPLAAGPDAVSVLAKRSLEMVRERKLAGMLWKDTSIQDMELREYFVNVDIDLAGMTVEGCWRALSNKVRGKVRQAENAGLKFRQVPADDPAARAAFYSLFHDNRKRLGVPVYPIRLFEAYGRHFPADRIKMFQVHSGTEVMAALLMLHNEVYAVDAYSASSLEGMRHRANDLLLFRTIGFCIGNGIRHFDFGADSPLQSGLIEYKLKWLGTRRLLASSVCGRCFERDHNVPAYRLAKHLFAAMPGPVYRLASRLVVR
jgi:hypothetical protein